MTEDKKFQYAEITKEKSLWDILKPSFIHFSNSKINKYPTFLISGIILIAILNPSTLDSELLYGLRRFSEIGLGLSASILGFLIAGFTIFASVSDKSIFVSMAKTVEKKTKLSYLKYNFFSLLYVFILYLILAISCFLIQLFLSEKSPFIRLFFDCLNFYNLDYFARLLLRFIYFLFFTFSFYTLLSLQSFIFNIYHIVMTSIRWELEGFGENSDAN